MPDTISVREFDTVWIAERPDGSDAGLSVEYGEIVVSAGSPCDTEVSFALDLAAAVSMHHWLGERLKEMVGPTAASPAPEAAVPSS